MEDSWSKHNISTRFMTIVFVLSYIAVVITGLMGVVIDPIIINMVWYSALLSFGLVTVGINGVQIILNGISKIKLGENKK